MLKRAVLPLAAFAALAFAPTASAANLPPNSVPNGTYYGFSWAFNSVFVATVKNNFIYGGAFYTQLFSGNNIVPGTIIDTFGNFGGQFGPGSAGYPIGNNGAWAVEADIPPGEPTVPTVCGSTKFQAKLVVSWNCTGPKGAMVGNPMFSAQTTKTPDVASGTYTGQVQTSPVPGSPNAPWTGTEGNLTLIEQNGAVSATALLAPVDPQTGLITAPPSVNVTYGPTPVGSSGIFTLTSNPAGYDLVGGFLPPGIPGLPANGMVAGTVNTFPSTFNNSTGNTNNGPAIAGSFQIPNGG